MLTEEKFLELTSDYLCSLNREQKVAFLVDIGHELTIDMRGSYSNEPQTVTAATNSPIYAINETQHNILGIARDLVRQADRADQQFRGLMLRGPGYWQRARFIRFLLRILPRYNDLTPEIRDALERIQKKRDSLQ